MKVAPKLVFLLGDQDGIVSFLADAVQSNPNSSLRRDQEPFELSLERYGIKETKASGHLVHFVDDKGNYQVSVLLLQHYEPPTLACAINEVLAQVTAEMATVPTILAPFFVESTKLKGQSKSLGASKALLYGVQIGADTDITKAISTKTQMPPPSLQIHYEPLACFLQLARVLRLASFVLIGQRSRSPSDQASGRELEILYEMGELLANSTGLRFVRDKIQWNPTKTSKASHKIQWNPTKTSKGSQEPWRALYG